MNEDIFIQQITDIQNLNIIEKYQRNIWGFSENQIVHSSLLFAMQRNGGLVLGAFDRKTEMLVGFLFSFIGMEDGRIKHCSDLLGVIPQYRSKGLGYLLKLEQRLFVISQGINLITWTCDPLESVNANLNLRKLGGFARNYHRDLFGSNYGKRNSGMPTDRLKIEWHIKSRRVIDLLDYDQLVPSLDYLSMNNAGIVNNTVESGDMRQITIYDLELANDILLVEVPHNIQEIKKSNINLALEWRLKIREIFENYLNKGYVIADFFSDFQAKTEKRRSFYVFKYSYQGNKIDDFFPKNHSH